MDYETEEQQVEALKAWWAENGRAVVAGVVIGAALIGGWRFWQHRTEQQAIAASDSYSEALLALQSNDSSEVTALADGLQADHKDSLYASLSSLAAASAAVGSNDLDGAARQLDWVAGNAPVQDIKDLARIRLARVLAAQGNVDAGLKALPEQAAEAFAGLLEEVRGDLLFAKGDLAAARSAYEQAQQSTYVVNRQGLDMKLNDLASVASDDNAS